tara:strand:- start:399 stop:587 length:189 start_codon:yes stop_codon:yes gene_type:complete
MALPITKKAAASCAKNMAEGTMANNISAMLIEGEKDKAKKFMDFRGDLEEGFDSVKSKDGED